MSGHVVYRPERPSDHTCEPPDGGSDILPAGADLDYPAGTVWQCDCDRTWVSLGAQGGGRQPSGGYAPGELRWKPESRRARRKRERQGITPEQAFGVEHVDADAVLDEDGHLRPVGPDADLIRRHFGRLTQD